MDELTLLRSIRSDIDGPRDSATQRTRDRLAEAIADETTPGQRQPRRRTHGRSRLVWGAGLPLVAAVTISLVAINLSGGVSIPGMPEVTLPMDSASAAEVLMATASISEAAADPVVGPGEFLKVTTTTEQVHTNVVRGAVDSNRTAEWGWLEQKEEQLFIPANHADEWVWVIDTTPEILGGEVLQLWGEGAAEGREELLPFITWGANPGEELTVRFRDGFLSTEDIYGGMLSPRLHLIDSMPSDPAELLAWYRQQAEESEWMPATDASAFDLMALDLRWNLFPPAQRGHIWRAMAEIPGIVISDRGSSEGDHPTATIALADATLTPDEAIDDPDAASLREITIDTLSGTLLSQRTFAPSPLKADGEPLYPTTTPLRSSTFAAEVVDRAP